MPPQAPSRITLIQRPIFSASKRSSMAWRWRSGKRVATQARPLAQAPQSCEAVFVTAFRGQVGVYGLMYVGSRLVGVLGLGYITLVRASDSLRAWG